MSQWLPSLSFIVFLRTRMQRLRKSFLCALNKYGVVGVISAGLWGRHEALAQAYTSCREVKTKDSLWPQHLGGTDRKCYLSKHLRKDKRLLSSRGHSTQRIRHSYKRVSVENLKDFIFNCVYVCVSLCGCMHMRSMEVGWVSWIWSHRELWAVWCRIWGLNSGSLHCWDIFPAHGIFLFCFIYIYEN